MKLYSPQIFQIFDFRDRKESLNKYAKPNQYLSFVALYFSAGFIFIDNNAINMSFFYSLSRVVLPPVFI